MSGEGRQRIDKWLFFARVVKSRSLAAKVVQSGRVRLNRDKIDLPSQQVKPGDVLTITLERRVIVYRVLEPGTRRGPAEEARTLYEDLTPPPAGGGEAVPDAIAPVRPQGSGRPTKKDRRRMDALRDDE
ncbi:RNA-binding S4 domain-containing protein [Neoaquamicrobium sediminum]|uniref:RNA-binding S4 domain-containing protein n=1 Tax=Neoaquamicrobium sediminum TaxID=1849104 RepID=A0ABV3WVN0_9HYPH